MQTLWAYRLDIAAGVGFFGFLCGLNFLIDLFRAAGEAMKAMNDEQGL